MMYRTRLTISSCAALLITAGAAAAATAASGSQPDPKTDSKTVLKAMDAASTWGHPDLWGEFAGMKRYARGDYQGAMKYFKYAARYADKPSQLGIGMMYANGLGVEKDAVTGCAWLMLAAERKYPRFVATRDKVCNALSPAQREQATAVFDKLVPEYGDKVAKKLMKLALHTARSERTGSHVGFDFGATAHGGSSLSGFNTGAVMGSASSACNSSITVDGIPWPTDGCVGRDFWSAVRWDPQTYFAARDAHFLGTVTVGNLQPVTGPGSDANPEPATASSTGH